MANLREYFDTDFKYVSSVTRELILSWTGSVVTIDDVSTEIIMGGGYPMAVTNFRKEGISPRGHNDLSKYADFSLFQWKSESTKIYYSGHSDPESLTKFLSCFIGPCEEPLKWCIASLSIFDFALAVTSDFIEEHTNIPGEKPINSRDHAFIGRIFLYCDNELSEEDQKYINDYARKLHLRLQIRSTSYSEGKEQMETPLAFISHDSRDKQEIAIKIAQKLRSRACPVWYDEYSLNVGDSLRESIEKGIKECKKCILVLTPNFLSNEGWTKTEFNSIFTREIIEETNVVLPIWNNVEKQQVYEYSPSLVDKFALNWSIGEDAVVENLHKAIIE